jgi:uncharacterized oligopeptide transporter (OPT) family protein
VLMMIPLRHGLIVEEHGKLAYPEGTACADVLIVGEKGGTDAKTVFLGFFVGLGYTFFNLIGKTLGGHRVVQGEFWRAAQEGHRRRSRCRRRCSASATSSARGSRRTCSPAACWRSWCSSR